MATKKTQKTASTTQQWNNIHGRMRIFANEASCGTGKHKRTWLNYSTCIGKKNDDNEYDNLWYNVIFRRDEAPDEQGSYFIIVKSGFLTLSVYKDGSIHPAVMVLDYEMEGDDAEIPF